LAAATIASTVAFQITHYTFFKFAAWLLLLTLVVAIGIVAFVTVKYMRKGEICIKED